MEKIRMVWGITGAGDYLAETMDVMRKINRHLNVDVTVLVSKSAQLVLKMYKLWDALALEFARIRVEQGPNQPFVAAPLQVGHFSFFFVSPATANTVAKIAHGIADTLITNCVSQAIKGGMRVHIYPVDQKLGSLETEIPSGKKITITTRQIDVENAEKLRDMDGLVVLQHPSEFEPIVASFANAARASK